MKKVNVILSTYNGEKYLEELLQSLIAQTYRNIDVWIRDDGSTDQTVEIIERYCAQTIDGIRFHHIVDDMGNIRPLKSFLQVLDASVDADYYAFCDQDDIWHPDKVQRAVDILEQQPVDRCFLYAAGYDICDSELNKIGTSIKPPSLDEMSVGKAFYTYGGGLGMGFTLVFNRALKDYAFRPGCTNIYGHDVWLWAVISGLGTGYYFDDCNTASYRRHSGTVSSAGKDVWSAWKWRLQAFWGKDKMGEDVFAKLLLAIQTYAELFRASANSPEDCEFLRLFGNRDCGIKWRIAKVFYRYRLKSYLLEELALRFAFLCGK